VQVRANEVGKPAKVVKKRALPAGGGGSGRSFGGGRSGWGAWQRSNSTNSTKSGSIEPAAAAETAPAAATAAASGGQDEGGEGDSSMMQQLYGLWQTDAFLRRAVDGKVPRNERGNVEVPPLTKAMPLGEGCVLNVGVFILQLQRTGYHLNWWAPTPHLRARGCHSCVLSAVL
jgi:xeroderma pigmentosum group C-complementing protein